MNIRRSDFIRTSFRIAISLILALVAGLLSTKVSVARDCSKCPGKGKCGGEHECELYLRK
ncbi:MAG: hypothetical protein JXR66_00895 [Bacteroidales bacterium]|nr:hypothetical protein [Bacteroidales bacterium]MBN2632081.1 hypothetical protein [Bacteroidales bacterium]